MYCDGKETELTKLALVGAAHGTVLAVLAFLAAGYGHGTYVVLGLASAPLGLLGIIAALIGLPFLWAAMFVLARRNRSAFVFAMLVHYLSAAVLLTTRQFADQFGDWDYFGRAWTRSGVFLFVCFLWYFAGQVLLWMDFVTKKTRKSRDPEVALN